MKLRRNVLSPLQLDTKPVMRALRVSEDEERRLLTELLHVRNAMVDEDSIEQQEMTLNQTSARPAFDWNLPDKLLSEYERDRRNSQLGRLFRCATFLHSVVDRVVILSHGHLANACRALLETCCQPLWNELSRAERGSKPRIYFSDGGKDNDATQALLHLLETHKARAAVDELDRWALVLIEPSARCHEAFPAVRHFLDALHVNSSRLKTHGAMIICVKRDGPKQNLLSSFLSLGLSIPPVNFTPLETFDMPSCHSDAFAIFTLAGLVPAAALGINVIELLQGASSMSKHFITAPGQENLILRIAAANLLFRARHSCSVRNICCWSQSLSGFGSWLEDLSSYHPHASEDAVQIVRNLAGRFDSWDTGLFHSPHTIFHHFFVNEYRFDDLQTGHGTKTPEGHLSSQKTSQSLWEATDHAWKGQSSSSIPYATLEIPRADELHMGQLMQCMMLATAIERKYELNRVKTPHETAADSPSR